MSKKTTHNDRVKRQVSGLKSDKTFQEKVDYVAKALIRGSWGKLFDQHLQGADSAFIVAVIMRRAERNKSLKRGIMKAFKVDTWAEVPWAEISRQFYGKTSRQIALMAGDHVSQVKKQFNAEFKNPEKFLRKDVKDIK